MPYTGAYIFGDSLVDSGNALKLANFYGGLPFTDLPESAPYASLGYFQGRFTNGYTFADLISNKTIGLVSKPVFPFHFEDPVFGIPIDPFAGDPTGHNLNFAYGGAQIRQGNEVVPDFDDQTDAFRDAVDNHADPNALYMVTIGGNDVRSLAPAGSSPESQAEAYATLHAAAESMLTEFSEIMDVGARNFLITGVPDVGLIPAYDVNGNGVLDGAEIARSAAATQYSAYLDNLIRTYVIPGLHARGANVTYVPIMGPAYTDSTGRVIQPGFDAILPEIAALHGLTADQLASNMLQYHNLVFFDQVHPTAQAHALIGSYMYSQLTGAPWVETMPLAAPDVDYRMSATIGAAGEVDGISVSLIAGTTYTFEMLGMSSLGTAGSLGDTYLKVLAPGGSLLLADDDSGAGFDSVLTFSAPSSGVYTVQMSAVGQLTGAYSMDAAVVSGAAMLQGNSYTVSSASTIVIEGAGGLGQDVVRTSVSYALSAGSEIEMLRTTNDHGKGAINLTGNDFGQAIVGNNGANIIDGKGGADVLTGGGGNDTFILSNSALLTPGNVDAITDYGKGDIVDVTQILDVAAGTNVISGGFLRVTTSGLVQVDVDGGGDHWATLSTINGSGSVSVRYLSDGTPATASMPRVADASALAASAAADSVLDLLGAHPQHDSLYLV
jgi:phospholipase/lecithinase/hemolysin